MVFEEVNQAPLELELSHLARLLSDAVRSLAAEAGTAAAGVQVEGPPQVVSTSDPAKGAEGAAAAATEDVTDQAQRPGAAGVAATASDSLGDGAMPSPAWQVQLSMRWDDVMQQQRPRLVLSCAGGSLLLDAGD